MRDFRKYDVWTKAHELTLVVYKEVAGCFPRSEQFELVSQMKRAAYSVPLNIAEGCGRHSDKDFVRFLDMSLGSIQELDYCFLLAKDLGYIKDDLYSKLYEKANEVKAKLIRLIKSIRIA